MSNKLAPGCDTSDEARIVLDRIRLETSRLSFEPRGTVRCEGPPMFRSKAARDAACLADLDPLVARWSCLPLVLECGRRLHVPDLAAIDHDGVAMLVDAVDDAERFPGWIPEAARRVGYGHRIVAAEDMAGSCRLENARELLRYSRWRVSLNDRVRLIAALEENGPLTVRACMDVLGTRDAIAAIAALALRRFVEIDLDDVAIGPDSRVRATSRS